MYKEYVMTGKRKMIGFYITTGAFLIVMVATVIVAHRAGWPLQISQLVETYLWTQTLVTGGFFGFNAVEHWAARGRGIGV